MLLGNEDTRVLLENVRWYSQVSRPLLCDEKRWTFMQGVLDIIKSSSLTRVADER